MSEARKRSSKGDSGKSDSSLVSVTIFGQTYSLRAEEDGTYVEDLARYVDTKMRTLSGSTGTSDPLRVAVLAALNIADEFFKLEERHLAGEARVEATARDLLTALEESLREPTQTSPALP
ncbi:MAG TPA: cell division protein ZapA [Vicinamibacteria bacterium]|jgi:cell division protein ZapA